jgi:poly(3-hydroxybutyrate) depolymerase
MRRREFIAALNTIAAWLGAQAWGLSLALFTLAGLLSGPADACSNPINPTLSRSIIHTALFLREFIVSGCADDVPPDGLPIVFGFHGGGEPLHDESGSGFLDFTDLSALHAMVIVPVGNLSNNGHSWINAYPWMKPHPENDLLLPAALIDWIASRPDLPRADLRRVYALGKSDGAGMSMALACHRDSRVNLVGVALVSGAYFGLESATNFGREDHEICLPKFPVRMMIVHGTGDRVMPYSAQNFLNPKALAHADDYWTSIDPTASAAPPSSRTYTADIARYVETLSSRVFHCAGFDETPFGSATTLAVGRKCDAPFHVLTVRGGNHVWPGHAMSGPDSGRYPNMDFDATAEIARFFAIPMSAIPFSAFTAQLTVYPLQSQFSIKASFTLSAGSNAINPPTESVTLKIGSFTITIPPGSFVNAGAPGYFTLVGVVENVSLNMLIRQTSGNNYIFGVIAKNVSLTIPNPPNTVPVTFTIGDDSGITNVTAVIINTK